LGDSGALLSRAVIFLAVEARILLFSLDELRKRYGGLVLAGSDTRHDTAPFRAFREVLLGAAARAADRPAELSMWWEGTYNGYLLAVAITPPDALVGLDAASICQVDDERVAPPRQDRYPLGRVAPNCAEVARDGDGAAFEPPFGAPTGHFGAPGMRVVPDSQKGL
jgi:hypothetical protein